MAAISKPPRAASTPNGSAGSGRCSASARAITSAFRATPASSSPVPRPAASVGEIPVNAHNSAAAAVELPIPISPAPRRSPSAACAMPASMARWASARDIAGSRVKLRVGWPTPMSTITGSIPYWRQSTVMAAPPARKFATICRVTSCGYGTDALFHHPVIRAEQQHRLAADHWHVGPLDQAHLQREFFQPPETPWRFGERIQPPSNTLFEFCHHAQLLHAKISSMKISMSCSVNPRQSPFTPPRRR